MGNWRQIIQVEQVAFEKPQIMTNCKNQEALEQPHKTKGGFESFHPVWVYVHSKQLTEPSKHTYSQVNQDNIILQLIKANVEQTTNSTFAPPPIRKTSLWILRPMNHNFCRILTFWNKRVGKVYALSQTPSISTNSRLIGSALLLRLLLVAQKRKMEKMYMWNLKESLAIMVLLVLILITRMGQTPCVTLYRSQRSSGKQRFPVSLISYLWMWKELKPLSWGNFLRTNTSWGL